MNVLSLLAVHASEALEVVYKILVFGLLGYEVCMEFYNLLW